MTSLKNEVGRLARGLDEALEQQAATAEVLAAINNSGFDLDHILQILVSTAARLCKTGPASIFLLDGDVYRFRTGQNVTEAFREHEKKTEVRAGRGLLVGRVAIEKGVVQIIDALEDVEYEDKEAASANQFRSMLGVPLLRDGEPIGVFALARTHVEPFSESQIKLVSTFANQAVIAIEGARLFNEVQAKTQDLQEALTYQTGSSKILSVIASSPTDVGPVLNAIVESACELCDAYDAVAVLKDGDYLRFSAHHGPIPLKFEKLPINRNWVTGRAVVDKVPIHVNDLLSPEGDQFPLTRERLQQEGHRTVLSVPMLRDGESIGAIVLRRLEVHPFGEKQIALLKTFANQAVIAIGNVRLFEEVQARTRDLSESLEQQTATSELLQIISSSPSDLAPVFEKMLENATRVCGAEFGSMNLVEGSSVRQVALYNAPAAFAAARVDKVSHPHPQSSLAAAIRTKQVVHLADLRTTPAYLERYPATVELIELGGARTVVVVPMLREDEVIGVITIFRQEIRPFDEKQIELLSNFAKQAVIAIENARLLRELRQRTSDLSKSLEDLRTAQDRLIQTEKLASLGQLTAGIAHEIKNPLNFVNNFSGLSVELVDELTEGLKAVALDDDRRADFDELTETLRINLQKVVQHGKRADAIVKNMLLHSRQGSGEHRRVEINALVEESLNLAYHGARAEKQGFEITLERFFDPNAGEADLFPQEITRVLLNLLSNGFYATTERKADAGGGFEPMLSAMTSNLGDKVEIRIRDNGTGIPEGVKDKIFNPFFTTKPTGEGTGLGLSMSHDIIVKQHGGSIEVATEPGLFTEFKIVLPRTSQR